jgi:hypothetical protein
MINTKSKQIVDMIGIQHMIRAIEWSSGSTMNFCPMCRRSKLEGHHRDCKIAAIIANPPEHPDTVVLRNMERVLGLMNIVLPNDIDDDMYEYSRVGTYNEGEWPEVWDYGIENLWTTNRHGNTDYKTHLTRRRRRHMIRICPTDQDAIDHPRRPCWVRNSKNEEWIQARLIAVRFVATAYPFIVLLYGDVMNFSECEIDKLQ